ncbi:MAG: hypothetical protein WAW87_06225 [Candidatus Ferrigenium altingense]
MIVDTKQPEKTNFHLLTHTTIPAAALKANWKILNQNAGLMPEQHVKTDAEVSHSTDGYKHGQQ